MPGYFTSVYVQYPNKLLENDGNWRLNEYETSFNLPYGYREVILWQDVAQPYTYSALTSYIIGQ